MNARHRKLLLLAPLVIASTAALTAATWPAKKPLCKIASEWVASHEDQIPATLAEFRKFAPAFRTAIYQRLTTPVIRKMWREQLEAYLAPDSLLTAEERSFVRNVINNDEYWTNRFVARRALDRDSLRERSVALFGAKRAGAIFTHLGGSANNVTRATSSQASLIAPLVGFLRMASERVGLVDPYAARREFCDCSLSGDYCSTGSCGTATGGCDSLEWGCGITGWYACTGQCLVT